MKKKLIGFLQFALGIGLIAYILVRMPNKSALLDAARHASDQWPWLLACMGILIATSFVCTLRWYLILRAQGLAISFGRATTLFFVGLFFNSFLFGATGGDVVRAYYVSVETHHKKTEAIATVFVDRIIGLLGLIILVLITMLLNWTFFLSFPETRMALLMNGLLIGASLLALGAMFWQNRFGTLGFLKPGEGKSRSAGILARAYNAFSLCVNRPVLLAQTLVLSIVNHLLFIAASFCIGNALGIPMSFLDYLCLFPIINFIAAIPITPGGLGTRDMAAIRILSLKGIPQTSAFPLSLLIYASLLAWSLIGGVFYMGYAIAMSRSGTKLRPVTADSE